MADDSEWINLPAIEKCAHKSWKARVAGYETCIKEFTNKTAQYDQYLGCIKKFITDTNANAQEKGCEAALAYLEHADCAKKVVRDAVSGVVVKGLNGKPKTKDTCAKIVLMCVELEKVQDAREEILEGFTHKQPKVIASAVNIVTQCLNQFGSKVFPIKPLIQKDLLKPILEHKDGKVRDEGKALVTEMYRWLGDTLAKLLTTLELKEVMLKELEEEWSKVEKGSPERYTRSQQAKMEEEGEEEEEEDAQAGGGGGGGVAEEEAAEDLDPYDLAEAVDILKILNKECSDFGNMLLDKSWKIRKEALDKLVPLAEGTIKIEPSSDFGSIVTPLAKIIAKDSNIVVVQLAVKCLSGIAKGLRKGFSQYARETIIACLSKYKEKKATVIAALSDCLDNAVDTIKFETVAENVIESLGDKNPSVRQETANFTVRLFQRVKANSLPKSVMKALCPALKKLLDDTVGSVRDAGAGALGTATKVVGEKFMAEYIADLDSIKKQKVTDVFEKAEVKYPYGASPAKKGAPAKAATAPPKEKKEPAKKEAAPATKKAAGAKKPAAKKGGPKKAAAPAAVKKADKQKAKMSEEITENELTDEQVDEACEGLLSEEIISGLANSNWKMRLEAAQGVLDRCDGWDSSTNILALVQMLGRKPGWKDNNAQVLKLKFEIAEKLAGKGDAFNKRAADFCIQGLVEKIGDIKLNKQACASLTAIAEAISLNFTSANAFKHAATQKNPKTHTEMLKWMTTSIEDFGMKINIKSHLAYIKEQVGSPNAQVRGAALNLIGTLSMYSGAAILAAFSDIDNKSTVTQIEGTIEKFKSATPPPPTRGVSPAAPADAEDAGSGEGEAEEEEGGGMDMEDLITRKDVAEDLDKLAEQLGSASWQERAEALDSVDRMLKEAVNIKPNLGSDFVAAIKARVADKNMAVKLKSIGIMTSLGSALGVGTKKHKELFVILFPLLSDSKKNVQAQVLDSINVWVEHVTIRPLLQGEDLVAASSDNNPNLRSCLFTWLVEQLKAAKVPPKLPKELNLLVPGLFKSLEDRNPEVRKSAQGALPYIMAHVGYGAMMDKCNNLDQKSKKTIQDLLEKNKEQADALAPKKPPPKPKADLKPEQPKKQRARSPVEEPTEDSGESSPVTQKKSAPKKGLGKKPALGGAAPAAKKKKGEEEDRDSPLKPNDKKNQRFKDESGLKLLKWNFKVPRQEYSDQLQELMEPVCSPGLFAKLFHSDFKQHNEALKILISIIPTHLNEIKQSLDLLLKWISLRFFDTNTSVLLSSLDWLSKCFAALREDDYVLLEQEASAFMPYLVTKLGDSKEPVRKSVQSLFDELCYIYPASRTFFHLSEGLKSKNSRQRTGVLEMETKLVLENGVSVCQPSPKKAFEFVASFIGDKDTSVRMAALNFCVAGWNYLGKEVYKLCGNLPEKDRAMLEERVKRGGKRIDTPPKAKPLQQKSEESIVSEPNSEEPKKVEPLELEDIPVVVEDRVPSPPPPPPPKKRGEFYIDYSKLAPVRMTTHTPLQPLVDDLTDFDMPEFNFKYNPVEQNLEGINFRALDDINFSLVEKIGNLRHPMIHIVIETVSELNAMLKDPAQRSQLTHYVDNLILTTTSQLTHFPLGDDEQELTVYRAITSIIMQVINHSELARQITTPYISKIFKLFLPVLSEDQKGNEAVDKLIKGVNALVIGLLGNCNTGRAICSLTTHMDSILDDGGRCKSPRELEILLKCLWKLMSRLEKDFQLTPSERNEVLVGVAAFLKRLPSPVWRDDHENDKPYRTVKTLIHRFCKGSGMQVLEDLECLSVEDSNILKTQVLSFLTALGFDTENQQGGCHGSQNPSAAQQSQLETIFNKMKDKDLIREAMVELHAFTRDNPSVDIRSHLAALTEYKRKLVEKILSDYRRKDNKVQIHRNKLQILAEREGLSCIKDLSSEQINALKTKPLSDLTNETKSVLVRHKAAFPKESTDVDDLIEMLPKEKEIKKSRLPISNSIPRPSTSPSRSPVRQAGGQMPSRSMDDLKKRLEMIKKRSKPT